jgi:hypothetical protein
MNLYVKCVLISIIGLCIIAYVAAKNLVETAGKTNVSVNWKVFFSKDVPFMAVGNMIAVALFLMLLDPAFKKYPKLESEDLLILTFFATVGAFGANIANGFLSFAKKRVDNSMDVKSDLADKITGNLEAPTKSLKPIEAAVAKQEIAESAVHQSETSVTLIPPTIPKV